MKKILTLFCVSLITGLILVTIGGIMINRGDVNIGEVYDIVEEGLQFGEKNVKFQKAEPPDFSDIDNYTVDKMVTYPLNEFNTVEIFAERCLVKLKRANADEMKISLDCSEEFSTKIFLRTAVKNGSLYVLTTWADDKYYDSGIILTVEIPDNYKGGYSINGDGTNIELCEIESSMDITFNLSNSTVNAKTLTAGDFLLELNSTMFNAERITSRDSVKLSSSSSTVNINKLESAYLKLDTDSSTADIKKISGGVTCNLKMSELNLDFQAVKGNINIEAETGDISIKIPHNAPISLHHKESYSTFFNKVKWAEREQKEPKNENARYIIDTNVKFSIVTLEEKE